MEQIEIKDLVLLIIGWVMAKLLDAILERVARAIKTPVNKKKPKPKRKRRHR